MHLGHQIKFKTTHTAQWFLHRGLTIKGLQMEETTMALTDLGAQGGQMVQEDPEVQEALAIRKVRVPGLKL